MNKTMTYRFMAILALIVGLFAIALQFIPGWEILTFMLSVAVLGGLVAGENGYQEQDRQRLRSSYKVAYEWLLLVMMAIYAFLELSRWLLNFDVMAVVLKGHWPGLVIAVMCTLMGIAGLQQQG